MPAVAEHRRAVGERVDFVHAMRNVEDRDILGLQPRQKRVNLLDVDAGQRRSRLIEDEQLRLLSERLGDLHHLTARQRQIAHPKQRIDVLASDFGEQRLGPPALGARVDHAEALGRRGD